MTSRRVALITAMESELRPLVKLLGLERSAGDPAIRVGRAGDTDIVATTTGMGTVTATEVTERLLGAHEVDHLVVVGIAGAVDPDIAIGTVVVPEVVIDGTTEAELRPVPLGGGTPKGKIRTSDEFVADDARLAELRARGVVAVDMETGSIGAVCERHGRPWSVFRAISDRAGDTGLNDVALSLAHPDGSPNMGAVARFFVTRPWDIPKLLQLGRDAKLASDNAAKAAVDALTRT